MQEELWAAAKAAKAGQHSAPAAKAGASGALWWHLGAWEPQLHAWLRRLGNRPASRQQQSCAAWDTQALGATALGALAIGLSTCVTLLQEVEAEVLDLAPGRPDLQVYSWRLIWAALAGMMLVKCCRGRYAASRAVALPCLLLAILLVVGGAAASLQQAAALAALGWLHLAQPQRRAALVQRLLLWDLASAAVAALLLGQALLPRLAWKCLLMGCTHMLLACLVPACKSQEQA